MIFYFNPPLYNDSIIMNVSYPKSIQELTARLNQIEQSLQYGFQNKNLILQALTHRSFLNESKEGYNALFSNERLEFLGDSIMDSLISHYLFEKFSHMDEGELSQLRSQIVDASTCEKFICQLNLQDCLLLGKGQRMSSSQSSLLADLFEAILAAIYLDGGWQSAYRFYWHHFRSAVEEICYQPACNWKANLQDLAQKKLQITPSYQVLNESGPDHAKEFEVGVFLKEHLLAQGKGSSKKIAQQDAAQTAMTILEKNLDFFKTKSGRGISEL
jgi:ribonuclease-3